ncbi:hypothetical protein B0H14DRAFT_2848816 [Mycena olivaceomarginata]|nr:hypothetical protein B0H14DRAFT_2848816 [Mycena olivaceomarginata]
MFRKSLAKYDLPIELTALINDTTAGTLVASHYVNAKTKVAVIFGTGCNAAGRLRGTRRRHPQDQELGHRRRGVNGDQLRMGCLRLVRARESPSHKIRRYRGRHDQQARRAGIRGVCTSSFPALQITPVSSQKLISGRYLGEILRLVICELIDEGVLFLGQNTYKLEVLYVFDMVFLSLMESDPTDELLMVIGIF